MAQVSVALGVVSEDIYNELEVPFVYESHFDIYICRFNTRLLSVDRSFDVKLGNFMVMIIVPAVHHLSSFMEIFDK